MNTEKDILKTQEAMQKCLNEALPNGESIRMLKFLEGAGEKIDSRLHALKALARFRKLAQQGEEPIERRKRGMDGRWKMTSGKKLNPSLMAETMTSLEKGGYQKHMQHGSTFLSLAVTWNDLTSLRWAMRRGFDPGLFDHSAGSTPMGQAAYDGQVETVRLFWAAGADVALVVTGEFGEQERYYGSTLLHRLFELGRKLTKEVGQVASFLIDVYPDPLIRNVYEKTFLDWANAISPHPIVATAREALAARLAREEAKELKNTLPLKTITRTAKPRL